MATGVSGTLHSTIPARTPTAWASIVTGKNPSKHGIFDMLWRRPGTYEFIMTNARVRSGTPFWKHLNNCGLRVGLVNVPFSYPPDHIDGFVVCGFGTPNSVSNITYPPEVQAWVNEQYGTYQPWLETHRLKNATPEEKLAADVKHQALQVQMAAELVNRYQVEILVINLMLPDHANHLMPHMHQVEEAICQTDADLDRLMKAFSPDNVMVISDHGSRRVEGDFLLHTWLRDHGYLVQIKRTPSEYRDTLNWVLREWLQRSLGLSGLPEKMVRRLARAIIPRLPDWTTRRFWSAVEKVVPFAREHIDLSEKIDYSRTQVFPGSKHSGFLYINSIGREPSGVVSAQNKTSLLNDLAKKLAEIQDPDTGKPLISGIYTPSELYKGSTMEHGPDLIIDSFDAHWSVVTSFRGSKVERSPNKYFVVYNRQDFGQHSRDGIYIFSGQDFNHGGSQKEAGHLMDLSATLLHIYGVPIPDDNDGRVLTNLLDPAFVSEHTISYQHGDATATVSFEDPYSEEEANELAEHLRMLGYLE
jgi:predicted AlkP superfamily phosphohydrolase/phosphomutase